MQPVTVRNKTTGTTTAANGSCRCCYFWNRPLGAADGVVRLTAVVGGGDPRRNSRSGSGSGYGGCCWALPLRTPAQLEREIQRTAAAAVTTLEVAFHTTVPSSTSKNSNRSNNSSSKKATKINGSSSSCSDSTSSASSSSSNLVVSDESESDHDCCLFDWNEICRSLRRHHGRRLRAVHFLQGGSDARRSALLEHLLLGVGGRPTTCRCSLTAVHVRDAPDGSERTLRVLAEHCRRQQQQQSQQQQPHFLRELVLVRCRDLRDAAEAAPLQTIVPHLERWVLDRTRFASDETWWRFFEWAENESPVGTAIAWEEPENIGKTAAHSTSTTKASTTTKETTTTQPKQLLLQDYLDWNCRLNVWRLHWLEQLESRRRISMVRSRRDNSSNSDSDNSNSNRDLVEAACAVLKDWYRSTHRPAAPRTVVQSNRHHHHHHHQTTAKPVVGSSSPTTTATTTRYRQSWRDGDDEAGSDSSGRSTSPLMMSSSWSCHGGSVEGSSSPAPSLS